MQHVTVSRSSTRPFRLTLATFGVFGALFGVWVVVPAVFSLAGDIAPTRKGEASSIITTVGYSGFLIGPALIGGLAEGFRLRVALATLIGAGISIVVLSRMVAAQ